MWWWRFFRPKSHSPEGKAPERPLPKPVPADPVTDRHPRLQSTVGNQAVQRLAGRQRTLRVSPLEDPCERQADQVADAAVRGNTDQVALAREESSSQWARVGPEVEDRLTGSTGGGQPLPEEVRAPMESTLGADLGEVRVHQDSEAAAMNERLNARAFTSGSQIWLGAGESVQDPRLMAHELTHVVQQEGRPGAILQRTPSPGETPEDEARRRAAIEGANIARERLVDALAGGYLWPEESVAEGGVSFYIKTEPVRTRQVARARISPRGIPAGAYIEVPDPENAPLHYILLRGFGEGRGRGPILEVWHDDFGYYYLYKERRIYLPRSPWR